VFGCAFASLSLLKGPLWHLYAIFIVLGIVGNGTAQLAYSRAVSTWFEHRRGMAFAVLMCGGAVGAMLLPPLAQWLVGVAGWRSAVLLLGAAVLLIGLPAGAQVREKPVLNGEPTGPVGGASVAEGLRSWVFWIIVLVLFCVSLGQNASIAHMAALLTDRGVPASSAALAVSVLGAATLLGRILTGWLLDRYFAPRVAFCLLATSALGVFLLSEATSAAVGFAGAALIGLGMGGEADVTPYLISRYFGLHSFATLYGFTWTAYAIAGAIGPVIMGRAFDATGSYAVLLLWLSVITAGAGSIMLLLPRYERQLRSIRESELSVAASAD
jgi:predicted MFS family arabinose efflux permease